MVHCKNLFHWDMASHLLPSQVLSNIASHLLPSHITSHLLPLQVPLWNGFPPPTITGLTWIWLPAYCHHKSHLNIISHLLSWQVPLGYDFPPTAITCLLGYGPPLASIINISYIHQKRNCFFLASLIFSLFSSLISFSLKFFFWET